MDSRQKAALKTAEAAAYLNVTEKTMTQWRWNGRGPRFQKLGRAVRYLPAELDLFLHARTFSSTTEMQAAIN